MSQTPQPPELDDINIPSPGALKVSGERPYRILVVADFGGGDAGSIRGPLDERIEDLRAESFDGLMAATRPGLNFTMIDPLATGNVMAALELHFESLKDFQPDRLAQQIPATRSLLAIRGELVERMRGKRSADQLDAAVKKAVAADPGLEFLVQSLKWSPAQTVSPGAVDSVLGGIDLGDGEPGAPAAPPPKSPLGAMIAAAAGGGSAIPAGESSAVRHTLAEVDRRIGVWLTAVLHTPAVQAVESVWRSLALLVSQTDFRKGVRIMALHAPRRDLAARFTSLLIDPVFDAGADAPDLIVVDGQFGNTAADMELVDELAQHAASLPAVLLAGVGPAFFGVKFAWQTPTLPALPGLFDQYQFAKFKTLRSQPYARSLGLIFGRGLLREPYRPAEAKDLELHYREECIGESDFVWASGALAAGCTVSRSVAETGWPTAMAGHMHGRVPGFVTAEGGKKGEKKFGPTDANLPQPKVEEMSAVGINAIAALRDLPDAFVFGGLTASRPAKFDPDGLLEVSLPYQLFAGRLSNLLLDLKPHLAGKGDEQIAEFVKSHVMTWLSVEGQPPAEVQSIVRALDDQPNVKQLAVTVTPPQRILPGGIPVVLGYTLQ